MTNLYNSLFLNNRLFLALGINACLFVLGFFAPFLFDVAKILLLAIVFLTLLDISQLLLWLWEEPGYHLRLLFFECF